MVRVAMHIETQALIDVCQLSPFTEGLLRRLHRNCSPGSLKCMDRAEHDHRGPWVYPKIFRGRWWLSHMPEEGERDHAGESDQHLWQGEYWCRAGDQAGYECFGDRKRTFNGFIPDVTIIGPKATIAVEVQHSQKSRSAAMGKTALAARSEVLMCWSFDQPRPELEYAVPHVRTNLLPDGHQPPGTWTVVDGPKVVEAVKCNVHSGRDCPVKGPGRWCDGYHAYLAPKHGVKVDDIAELLPGGGLVVLSRRRGRRVEKFLVSPEDNELYQHLLSGEPPPQKCEPEPAPFMPGECQRGSSALPPVIHPVDVGPSPSSPSPVAIPAQRVEEVSMVSCKRCGDSYPTGRFDSLGNCFSCAGQLRDVDREYELVTRRLCRVCEKPTKGFSTIFGSHLWCVPAESRRRR